MSLEAVLAAMPSPRAFVEMLGIRIPRGGRPDKFRVCCPWHNEKNPACEISQKNGRIVAHCHSCHAGGDAFSLAAVVWGLDERRDFFEVLKRVAELLNVQLETSGQPRQPRAERDPAADLAELIDSLADQWVAGREVRTLVRDVDTFADATPEQWARAMVAMRAKAEREREVVAREDEADRRRNDELEAMADDVLRAIGRREAAAVKALRVVPDQRDLDDEAAEREAIQSDGGPEAA